MGGAIRNRILRLQDVASRVEAMNRYALVVTAERIIRYRISSQKEQTREGFMVFRGLVRTIAGLDYGDSEANLGPSNGIQDRLEKLRTEKLGIYPTHDIK